MTTSDNRPDEPTGEIRRTESPDEQPTGELSGLGGVRFEDTSELPPVLPADPARGRGSRWSTGRRIAIVGGAAAVVALGGGAIAWANASDGQPAASAPSGAPSGAPTGAPTGAPSGAPGGGKAPSGAPSGAPTGKPSGAPSGGTAQRPTPKPHLDGTVTSVSGSTILIKDPMGFTRTIVTSSKTTYTDGLSASSIKTGSTISAEGTVDANGTSLDATTIGTRPSGPAGGPGAHGGPGAPGGSGGKGPGGKGPGAPGKAPSGAPSGAPSTGSTSS